MNTLLSLFPRWSIITFLALLALGGATLAAPALMPQQQTGAPIGVDSLTDIEAGEAEAAAVVALGARAAEVRTSAFTAADGAAITASATSVVLTERHDEGKQALAAGSTARRADVYLYNYVDDTLQHALYDYADKTLTTVETAQGVQFPLTQAERTLATQLAFADPALFSVMQEEFRTLTGKELIDPAQLDIRAFVYHSGAAPETEPPEAAVCGVQRCAQLLIVADQQTTFHALPVVNLSTLSVASIFPLALDPIANPGPGASASDAHDHDTHSHEGGE